MCEYVRGRLMVCVGVSLYPSMRMRMRMRMRMHRCVDPCGMRHAHVHGRMYAHVHVHVCMRIWVCMRMRMLILQARAHWRGGPCAQRIRLDIPFLCGCTYTQRRCPVRSAHFAQPKQ